jgi:hypothetical protein
MTTLPVALPSPRVGPGTSLELGAACRVVGATPHRWELTRAVLTLPLPPHLSEPMRQGLPLSIPISRQIPNDPLVMLELQDPLLSLTAGHPRRANLWCR